jgi:hypothetical protein
MKDRYNIRRKTLNSRANFIKPERALFLKVAAGQLHQDPLKMFLIPA